ncbi:putative transposable element [Trichonephila clavipes]|nr:putative transposable element [Trichonephila clavipes]
MQPQERYEKDTNSKKSATKTFQILTKAYGDQTLSRTHVFQWYKRFSGGRVSVEDDKPAGRPSDEAHFWLNGYVNKQNCRIWSEANPQEYVETPLPPEKLTVWCALWAGGILLQKR